MKKYIIGLLVVSIVMAACEKKVAPVDDYKVTVEYRSTNPKTLISDVTLNPKDSIYFDFTVTSPVDMSYVEIQKNGVRIDTFRLTTAANKKSFSLVKGYRTDSIPGDYSYRVLARNDRAVFMGDGGKQIKVTISPDFDFWSYRILQVPDSINKTNKSYYALTTGKTYSYSEAAANSALIDFGYYYDTAVARKHTFYALNTPQPQLGFYDITSFTKNATVFKKMPNSVNFVSGLTSAGSINTLIRNNMTSGTTSSVNTLSAAAGSVTTATNNVIGFKTASGKYGAILVRFTNQDSPAKETRIEIDVKVQK